MDNVSEIREYRNKRRSFTDREDAGEHLASMLEPDFRRDPRGLVLAIPSGGVPVGQVVSRRLSLPFDLILVRKLQIPHNTEAGFGAAALGGETFLNQGLVGQLRLQENQIREQEDKVRRELEERNQAFRGGRQQPGLADRKVILTDDGLASGYTMIAAIDTARKKGASSVVVAVPTAPLRSVETVSSLADSVYVASVKESGPFAVAEAYANWKDLSREEVISLLGGSLAGK